MLLLCGLSSVLMLMLLLLMLSSCPAVVVAGVDVAVVAFVLSVHGMANQSTVGERNKRDYQQLRPVFITFSVTTTTWSGQPLNS